MNTDPDAQKAYEENLRHARTAHAREDAARETVTRAIESFSIAAMRAPGLAAAGGVAAVLGFFSANYERLKDNVTDLNAILFWMFGALLLVVVAPGAAYFSQIFFGQSSASKRYDWEHPYVHSTKMSTVWKWIGEFFRALAVLLVVGSYTALIMGGWQFLGLIK